MTTSPERLYIRLDLPDHTGLCLGLGTPSGLSVGSKSGNRLRRSGVFALYGSCGVTCSLSGTVLSGSRIVTATDVQV